jgi:hypothetical protein
MVRDPEPRGSLEVRVAARSQLSEASLASERQARINNATGSQPPEADLGSDGLETMVPRLPEPFSDLGSHMPLGLEPMKVDELDPPREGPYYPAPGVLRQRCPP